MNLSHVSSFGIRLSKGYQSPVPFHVAVVLPLRVQNSLKVLFLYRLESSMQICGGAMNLSHVSSFGIRLSKGYQSPVPFYVAVVLPLRVQN
jgi:hypothetical protein